MNHREFLSQLDKWEVALDRGEALNHFTNENKPPVESSTESYGDVMNITELEVFLNEMSNSE